MADTMIPTGCRRNPPPRIAQHMREDPLKRLTVMLVAFALVASACGAAADAEVVETTTTTAAATTTTEATTTTTEATTTTAAPTTTTTEASGIVEGEDPEVDAIVAAYTIALDSVTP